eukprot:70966-Prymnesium_polylepis.1
MLWAARIVTEKVKTDQRSRALELLCLGIYGRGAALSFLIERDGNWLRESFARQYSGDDQQTMSALGKRGWERSRLSFAYLELARRTWLNSQPGGCARQTSPSSTVGRLLLRITRAAPEDKVLNSLLYWLLDLAYKEMRVNQSFPRWAPEPFLLRLPGVEARMIAKLAKVGHLLELLSCSPSSFAGDTADAPLDGAELLRVVREVETTVLLLNTLRTACEGRGERVPQVVERYTRLIAWPGLQLRDMQTL